MIVYEYPLTERTRIYLRLEYLANRLNDLVQAESVQEHHFALQTLFQLVDISDSCSDLKINMIKDLERFRESFLSYLDYPDVDSRAIEQCLAEIAESLSVLNGQNHKINTELVSHEWLTSVRSRMSIPAGTCEFDHPSYFEWQHRTSSERRADLVHWVGALAPTIQALFLILRILRDSGAPHKVMATQGTHQQNLTKKKDYQLLRIFLRADERIFPEISGNRLIVTIRLMRRVGDKIIHCSDSDGELAIALCA